MTNEEVIEALNSLPRGAPKSGTPEYERWLLTSALWTYKWGHVLLAEAWEKRFKKPYPPGEGKCQLNE